jgi:hypothetical protein
MEFSGLSRYDTHDRNTPIMGKCKKRALAKEPILAYSLDVFRPIEEVLA